MSTQRGTVCHVCKGPRGYVSYGSGTICRPCYNRRAQERRAKKWGSSRGAWLHSKYRLTVADWDAMFESQNGLCAICQGRPATVTDHDHTTKNVRGLLCVWCNTGIGMLGDCVDGLERALAYLQLAAQKRAA